jgi:hypothetical protein
MRSSPDRNCGRFSKYLTSKIGDSKHDDDEKMQHKKLVPVHNMLRGYTFSGASAGDAIPLYTVSNLDHRGHLAIPLCTVSNLDHCGHLAILLCTVSNLDHGQHFPC